MIKSLCKALTFFLILLFGPMGVYATILTPEQAWSRAQSTNNLKKSPIRFSETTTHFYTHSIDNAPALYIFHSESDNGFLMLSADDQITPVLAYSTDTSFDPEDMPENMRWWIDEYAREIQWSRNKEGGSWENTYEENEYPSISPLISTAWRQDDPYNMFCPTLDTGNHAITGCVATAVA